MSSPNPVPAPSQSLPAPTTSTPQQLTEARQAITASLAAIGSNLDTEIRTRTADLHSNRTAIASQEKNLAKQTKQLGRQSEQWDRLLADGTKGLNKVGDVQNWAECVERELLVLEETLRLVDGGEMWDDGLGFLDGDLDGDRLDERIGGLEEEEALGKVGKMDGVGGEEGKVIGVGK